MRNFAALRCLRALARLRKCRDKFPVGINGATCSYAEAIPYSSKKRTAGYTLKSMVMCGTPGPFGMVSAVCKILLTGLRYGPKSS